MTFIRDRCADNLVDGMYLNGNDHNFRVIDYYSLRSGFDDDSGHIIYLFDLHAHALHHSVRLSWIDSALHGETLYSSRLILIVKPISLLSRAEPLQPRQS